MAFVCDQFGECSSKFSGGGLAVGPRIVVLEGSVGRGGRNLQADVSSVQDALNQIGMNDGGPVPLLKVDGFVGPKTVGAIERFQKVQFPGKFPDGKIDPGQRTVGRLNELLNVGVPIAGASGSSFEAFAPSGGLNGSGLVPLTTTNDQIALAERLAEDAERRITAAVRRLNNATTALSKKVRTPADRELVREIDWHFKASADTNPVSHMAKISTVLATMLTAVREQNLGIRTLFKGGTHPDPTAIAAAELGGFFSMKQEDRFIIITPQFRTQSSGVIVHELGHFCGGNKSSGKDIVHRASPSPAPNGVKKEDGSTNYRDMPPFHARTNVYSYQIYCFPDLPEFKVPAGF